MDVGPSLQLRQKRALVTTPQLRQAIGLLQTTNAGLRDLIAAEAAKNPYLDVRLPSGARESRGEARPDSPDQTVPDHRPSLMEHVFAQIDLCVQGRRARDIALRFAEALEPSGWLGRSVADIARDCGCALAEAEAVLAKLQGCEPAGLFARDLRDCLTLQAAERGILTAEMRGVLDNLPLVAEGALDRVADICGTDVASVRACVARIRHLNPKPGADFHFDQSLLREPDVIVTRGEDGWQVDLNRSTLPTVIVRDVPRAADRPAAGRQAAELLQAARWLERAVEQRNRTTLAVSGAVVERQAGFLERGASALRPLTLADVATALDIHESTVCRVCNGLMLDTPRGVLPMKAFFCGAVPSATGGDGVDVAVAQHRLQQIVLAENPQAPLSDAAIAESLRAEGIVLARRTVAKYRGTLNIASAPARRRSGGTGPAR